MAIVKHPAGGNPADLRDDSNDEAKKYLSRAGYKHGGRVKHPDEAEDKKLISKMIHKEEKEEGRKETKFKKGGKVEGEKAKPRLDKFARGGHVKGKHGGNKVNIVIAPGQGGQPGAGGAPDPKMAFQAGLQKGAQMAAQHAGAGGPPPAPGGAPMGAPPRPMPPPPGAGGPGAGGPPPMARGGMVTEKEGSRSGEGRMEKIADEKKLLAEKK